MRSYQLIESHRCCEGIQNVYSHWSESTKTEMRFALFMPPLDKNAKASVLYWLSGLTCSEQNFITKAGAQKLAAKLGMALVVPDTSPRGIKGLDEQEYLGEGASFYLDASEEPWREHYQMYTYLSQELPQFIAHHFPIDTGRCGISGHSMGGHGALIIGLRNPHLFRSISAFAPISSLSQAPWGINALSHYLGNNTQKWVDYDACSLLKNTAWPHGEILVEQGSKDPFLNDQLKPHLLQEAARDGKNLLNLRLQPGYDHSYYFVSTFIAEHLEFHNQQWL
ncbi:S-formylglutathione hydrolase [Legionella sp. km772]|uniref:S-formylglutathione hydrolase n=1 Tax=Legionella sp. km772 TaxID=2498111 RepID=UPI000F8E0DA0|nr:S-formylglutathione hydrolase [Legionella sp. km772]RUR12632.1 S-formylglutathione hydrolase [Legionella sp. km772]